MRPTVWRRRLAALVAGAAALAPVALPAPAGAEGEIPADAGLVTVAGEATASGVRFSYEVPAEFLAATTPVDGGGPMAQASLGSGLARSAASLPFPGDLVIAGPGLFYLATGVTLPGSYPFYVSAEHPGSPESALGDPSGQYQLSARADGNSADSLAKAVFGPPDGGSGGARTQTSIVVEPDGSAVASAESVSEGLSLGGGTLKIAAVRSVSVTRLAAGTTNAVTERKLAIEGATVSGQAVTIDASGVHAGGGSAPVPFGSGAEQISTALAQAGLSVRVAEETDAAGNSAQVLEVRDRHPLPFAGNPQGTFTWRIGRAATSLVRTGFLPAPEPEPVVDTPAGPPAAESAPAGAPDLGPAGPGPLGAGAEEAPAGEGTARAAVSFAGYDPGPVAGIFEGVTGVAADAPSGAAQLAASGAVPAVPASRSSGVVGLDRVRTLYGAVGAGALLVAALAGLWWRKGVSWRAS
ncbi:MAG TPA: hypothetical protein VFS16_20460 [Acidimicrobiia bacterium]|nr:hypothetical protein [Acidimicrobiia bacterium]